MNLVTPALFKRYPTAAALAKATAAELEPQIHSTGFFRAKSKALAGMARALVKDHGGEVPADMEALTKLPGVGRKTANVVLGHALGVPGLPVDRHVLRVANRIGIAESDKPEIVEQQLCEALPACAVDAHIGHPHPARPPDLQAQAAVRSVRRAGRLRVLPGARPRAGPGRRPKAFRCTAKSSSASSLTRSRQSRGGFAMPCATSRSSSTTSRRRTCSRRWRSSRPTRCSGLYQGIPLTERRWDAGNDLPDRILIFQGPHERAAEDDDDLAVAIAETLIHEIGHYFGMSEEEIEDVEENYWRKSGTTTFIAEIAETQTFANTYSACSALS